MTFLKINICTKNQNILNMVIHNLVLGVPWIICVAFSYILLRNIGKQDADLDGFKNYLHTESHQTGSGHGTDSKLSYTKQISIAKLCAKYQEANMCGSLKKKKKHKMKTTQSDPYNKAKSKGFKK